MTYVHHIPGRMRVRCEAIKRNERNASRMRELLNSMGGVNTCEVNTLTGGVLIHYDSSLLEARAIIRSLKEHGFIQRERPITTPAPVPINLRRALSSEVSSAVARKVATHIVETAIERSVVALVAALL